MEKIKVLAEKLRQVKKEMINIEREIASCSDGFLYFTELRRNGITEWQKHINYITVQSLCNKYWNNNDGVVQVYTNNPNYRLNTYWTLNVLSLEELKSLANDLACGYYI